MGKPIYEIPVTDPGAPPFGAPGAVGALPPQRGAAPPPSPDVQSVDLSQLGPPPVQAAAAPAASAEIGRAHV